MKKNKKIEIIKTKREKIIIQPREFKGKEYLDLRTFYINEDDEYVPSQKGITMSHDLFPEFYNALKRLYEDDYNTD